MMREIDCKQPGEESTNEPPELMEEDEDYGTTWREVPSLNLKLGPGEETEDEPSDPLEEELDCGTLWQEGSSPNFQPNLEKVNCSDNNKMH